MKEKYYVYVIGAPMAWHHDYLLGRYKTREEAEKAAEKFNNKSWREIAVVGERD